MPMCMHVQQVCVCACACRCVCAYVCLCSRCVCAAGPGCPLPAPAQTLRPSMCCPAPGLLHVLLPPWYPGIPLAGRSLRRSLCSPTATHPRAARQGGCSPAPPAHCLPGSSCTVLPTEAPHAGVGAESSHASQHQPLAHQGRLGDPGAGCREAATGTPASAWARGLLGCPCCSDQHQAPGAQLCHGSSGKLPCVLSAGHVQGAPWGGPWG